MLKFNFFNDKNLDIVFYKIQFKNDYNIENKEVIELL